MQLATARRIRYNVQRHLSAMPPPAESDQFDLFVSYARKDNAEGWITRFLDELLAEHRKLTGGDPNRELVPFFDKQDIGGLDDWQHRIHDGLSKSRLFLAFISPHYFASEWCRREWKGWIDTEIAKHILSAGAAPIYFVEVPGFVGKVPGLDEQSTLTEQQVAEKIAALCGLPAPHDGFTASVAPILRQMRDRRQITSDFVRPFRDEGVEALRRADLHTVLEHLTRDIDQRVTDVKRAADSITTVPPYNKKFTGRLDELLGLRARLKDDLAGVISGVHGLGGIGKTELAFTFAHAFASAYPGGRFLIACENKSSLRDAVLGQMDFTALFRDGISEEERMQPDVYFAAIARCLRARLDALGHVLLVLDNVTDTALLSAQQTDALTALGPRLHLLATTRLAPPASVCGSWLSLGELPAADALELLEKHRKFDTDAERDAARRIVKQLGGFALAVELVAAWLAAHEASSSYARLADGLGLDDLEAIAGDEDVELRRHNHERRLSAVLGPVLDSLQPAERRALEYAALLPPDHIALPWLRALVVAEFPEIAQPARLSDPWIDLLRRLERLALLTRPEGETTEARLMRVHRLVQELMKRGLFAADLTARQQAVDALVKKRDAVLQQTTRWTEARWELEPLTALAAVWDETSHAQAVWLLNQACWGWRELAEWSQAEPLMRRALAIDEESFGPEHPNVATRLNNLAQLLEATNRLAEAEPLMRRALAIDEQSFGPEHPEVATGLNNLATLLQATNRLTEAEPLMRRALAIDEQSFGPDHPNVARDLNNLAQLLQATNRLTEAEPLMRRALAIDEQSFGPDHPEVATGLNNLATLLQATNRLAEAEPLMRRALAILETNLGAEHPQVAAGLNNLALLLLDTNRLAEAEPLMRRALAIDEQSFGPEHPKVAIRLNNFAQLLKATNRLAEAEPLMRRGVEIVLEFTRATGHSHPHLQTFLDNYARLLKAMGRSQPEVRAQLNAVCRPYGIQLGGQS